VHPPEDTFDIEMEEEVKFISAGDIGREDEELMRAI